MVNGALRLPGLPAMSKGFFDSNASVVLPWADEYIRRMTPVPPRLSPSLSLSLAADYDAVVVSVSVAVSQVLHSWFGEYKAIGGELDMLAMDWESQGSVSLPAVALQQADNGTQMSAGSLIESDPRWPELQAQLNARGSEFDVSFPSLAGWESWAADAQSTDSAKARLAAYRTLVWNDVMIQRTATILNTSVFQPAQAHFSDIRSSNCETPPAVANRALFCMRRAKLFCS